MGDWLLTVPLLLIELILVMKLPKDETVALAWQLGLAAAIMVTAIVCYHYVRIFNSWVDAFDVQLGGAKDYTVTTNGQPFNDAYRYVDWLLTVPLLLIELILVMKLPVDQTVSMSWNLGVASAAMVALGYPGEIQENPQGRFGWWAAAMVPFMYVVYTLLAGLNAATDKQPESAKGLIVAARYLTAISWLTYPGVYMIKMVGLAGPVATTYEQVGYSIADVVAKAVFGVLIWAIASAKSSEEERRIVA